jgi:C4-dicarboxylate transporter, DctM subunit
MTELLIAFGVFFFILVIGGPLVVGLLLGAIVGLYLQIGLQGTWGILADGLHHLLAEYVFATIVMFILLSFLADAGGLGRRAYDTFFKLFGHFRGGVFIATIFAAAAFGSCSGSSVASAAMFGRIAYPEMKRFNYDEAYSLGCIAVAGSLAFLIPPSTIMVIYGILTNVSIGRLLIGGIVPGCLLAGMLAFQVFIQVRLKPRLAPTSPQRATRREQLISVIRIWPLVLVFAVIILTMWTGLVTPSEAASLGVLVVFIWCLTIGVSFKSVLDAFLNTAVTAAQIVSIIAVGLLLSKVVVYSGVAAAIVEWITVNNVSLIGVWLTIVIIWFILGMIIDPTSMLVVTLPLFFPIMMKLGVDGVAFGIVAVAMVELAVVTPPVGFDCFVVASVTGVSTSVVFRGIMPFIWILFVFVFIMILFPQIATFLPNLAYS